MLWQLLEDWLTNQSLPASKVFGLRDIKGTIGHVGRGADESGARFAYFDFMMLRGASVVFGTESGFNRMAAATGDHERRVLLPYCVEYPSPY